MGFLNMSAANTFTSMKPNLKEAYPKKKKFQKTRKAMSELDASKDPMKALKDKSYLNLKGKKGVAV
jgi:hypothetical protein